MIKNDRQYRITKAQAARFARTLETLQKRSTQETALHPLLREAELSSHAPKVRSFPRGRIYEVCPRTCLAGLESQLADLQAQMAEYEALRGGGHPARLPDSLEDLPHGK